MLKYSWKVREDLKVIFLIPSLHLGFAKQISFDFLNFFSDNLRDVSSKLSKRFYQDISVIEASRQVKGNYKIMSDYCCYLEREREWQ